MLVLMLSSSFSVCVSSMLLGMLFASCIALPVASVMPSLVCFAHPDIIISEIINVMNNIFLIIILPPRIVFGLVFIEK